jgi:hypothetical protein
MMRDFKIFPECYADTLLIETLFPHLAGYVSHKDGTEVAKDMEKFPAEIVIGVVDNDKRMPSYFKSFQIVEDSIYAQLQWKKHPERDHHIIVLSKHSKGIELWLYHAAFEINPAEFGLPSSLEDKRMFRQFRKRTKSLSIKSDIELCAFIQAICEQETEPINLIKTWIKTITNL